MLARVVPALALAATVARADAPLPSDRPRACTIDEWRRLRRLIPPDEDGEPLAWVKEKALAQLDYEDWLGENPCATKHAAERAACRRARLDRAEAASCTIAGRRVDVQPDCLGWRYTIERGRVRFLEGFGNCD